MVYKFTAEVLNRIRSKLEKSIKDQIEKPMGSPQSTRLDASGNLKRSIKGVVFSKDKSIYMEIFGASYFDLIDKGGPPRTVSQSAILKWIDDKPVTIRGHLSKKVVAKRIVHYIKERGTIQRFGGGGAEIIDYIDRTYYDWITKELWDGYYKDLEFQLDNILKKKIKNVNK